MVLFLRRPGSQSQFSLPLWSAQPRTDPIRAVLAAIHADPGARHSIADLAGHAGLSPRHLQRRFTAEIGSPPAAYVERVRIEAAQRALTGTDEPVATVARRCGFGTAETLRRAFHRTASVAPSDLSGPIPLYQGEHKDDLRAADLRRCRGSWTSLAPGKCSPPPACCTRRCRHGHTHRGTPRRHPLQ